MKIAIMDTEHSMDQVFIKKVTELLEINLGNEQFGVKELASEMGMSRSNLHRKLQNIYYKSTSQFIREYRLEKAMVMLQNNVATASEISFMVGFGSDTYFNTCFHDYYGYPPGEAKIREANTEENQLSIQNKASKIQGKITKSKKIPSIRRIISISFLGLVLIISISYLIYSDSLSNGINETTDDIIKDKSIAVLPFKNLSDDKSNQYFADGVMEVISNQLSGIKEFKVISGTSMEQYRKSNRTFPEIARELGISYILAASIQKYGDTVRIIVQLIDAQNDQNLWSDDFEREFKDIFAIQSDIAKRVAKELKTTLTPVKLEQIEKNPTNDPEAYNLYLKGRFYWNKGTEEDVNNSINYFEQSIKKDPEFALAYAGLSQAYLNLTRSGFISYKEGTAKVKEFALISIELDSSIAEAHATLGFFAFWFEWNWTEAEKELKLSLKLNPNSAEAHMYYAEYLFRIEERSDDSREHMNQAIFLDHTFYAARAHSAAHYLYEGRYDKAHIEIEKAKEINKHNQTAYWTNLDIYIRERKYRDAVDELKHIMQLDTATIKHFELIETTFVKSGIKGVFRWFIEFDLTKQDYNRPYYSAQKYAFLGEKEKALALLETSFKLKIPHMMDMNENFYFENLRSEPRFISLVKKIGLEDYE